MLNRAILMGRLTADPEPRTTPSGVSVCSFCIAVGRPYMKDKEKQTDFINIVAWRSSADFVCKYFKKGGLIIVEGGIQTRSYEDKNGNKRTAVEVVASNVQFGESKRLSQGEGKKADVNIQTPEESSAENPDPSAGNSADEGLMDSKDLPF